MHHSLPAGIHFTHHLPFHGIHVMHHSPFPGIHFMQHSPFPGLILKPTQETSAHPKSVQNAAQKLRE
eukprot:1160980-Pelagomonas_calceolata.AAC.6